MVQNDRWAGRIVESASDAVLIADASGLVLHANAAADTMLGLTRNQLVGARLTDLLGAARRGTAGRRRVTITTHADRGSFDVELTDIECSGQPPLRAAFLRELPEAASRPVDADALGWGLDGRSLDGAVSDEFYPVLGMGNGNGPLGPEGIRSLIHPTESQAVRDLLSVLRGQPGDGAKAEIETDTRLLRPDGTMREIHLRGRVERDESGELAFAVGVVQDVSGPRNTGRERAARNAVTRALRDGLSFGEGVGRLMQRFGAALELQVGSLWTSSEPTGELSCAAAWSADEVDATRFHALTRGLTYPPRAGAISLVWDSARAVVMPEPAAELDAYPAELIAELGLAGGLAFPAIGGDGTLAVAAFYGERSLETSERLLLTLDSFGHELGHFLELHGRLQSHGLTARELEVLRDAADGHRGPEIAARLVISPSTVKTHFENIYEKLGVSDRAAAVAEALRSGLIA